MNVIRIPTKFSKSIKRLSDKDRLFFIDSLLKIGDDEKIEIPDNSVGDVISLVYGEWMNMESKNGTKPTTNHISELPANIAPSESAPRVEYNRVEESKIEESKKNNFENFWTLYPNKVNKKDSRIKYEIKCKQDGEENIINGLNAWIQKWKIENKPEYIPAPDVWLNKEKYNDELGEIHPTDDELEDYKDTNQLGEKYDIVGKYRPAFLELRKKGKTATEEERAQAYEIRKEFERTYNLI